MIEFSPCFTSKSRWPVLKIVDTKFGQIFENQCQQFFMMYSSCDRNWITLNATTLH